jgi:glycosyltransferase involved in cell wall biosynthesis
MKIEIENNLEILIVSNSLSGGGAEVSMRAINKEFIKQGISSKLVCLNYIEGEKAENNEVILNRKWKSGIRATLNGLVEFREVVSRENPTLIIVNCELPELYVALTNMKNKWIIAVEHTSLPWYKRRLLGMLVRFTLRLKSTSWVTVNSNQKSIWPYKSKCFYIPNPLRAGTLENQKSHKLAPFVFIGRLRKEKDPEIMLAVSQQLKTQVEVFGDGELMEELSAKYSDTGIFRGHMSNPWAEIALGQVVVVPSQFEGDGLVIVEAISRRQPLILRDNKDLRRFDLPEENYFDTPESLNMKFRFALADGTESLKPSLAKSLEYLSTRNIEAVVRTWKDYILK